jgi:hypothetical protein
MVVGAGGVLIGLWPMLAAARGEFIPGPFTSPYWTITALTTGAWFGALATALPVRGSDAHPGTDPAAAERPGSRDWTPAPASRS